MSEIRIEYRWRVPGDWIGPGPASDSLPSVQKYRARDSHIERRTVVIGAWEPLREDGDER